MKKIILSLIFSLSLIFFGASTNIQAKESTSNDSQVIVISASNKSSSTKYAVYKLKNKKMVKTSKSVNISNKKGILHWKATKKVVDGKTWWKIGKNEYFKNTRVEIIDTARMKEINRKISNYAN